MTAADADIDQLVERHRRAAEEYAFEARVAATWALVGAGARAVPAVISMLRSPNPDIREDAAGILGTVGKDPEVVQALVATLENEVDQQARDSIIVALGALRSREAIPTLARIVRNDSEDGDTRFTALQSLGQIAGKRFDRREDPYAAALTWLDRHGQ